MLDVHHVQRIAPHKRKIYSNEKTLYRPLGSPVRSRSFATCPPENSRLKISAPLKCAGRRLRPRSHSRIERVVSLSWSRSVWIPGRVSTERKGDTRIFVARIARPSIIAVSIQGISQTSRRVFRQTRIMWKMNRKELRSTRYRAFLL